MTSHMLPPIHCLALALAFVAPHPPRSTHSRVQRPIVALEQPLAARDELKSRFSRGDEETPKTTFRPVVSPSAAESASGASAPAPTSAKNQQLLAEIRALQPPPLPPKPEKKAIDLNGIQPSMLLLGGASYALFSTLAWQGTNAAGAYFAENPFESSFYVVQRLSSIARVVVVSLGSLGTGITGIAAVGQIALAVQVQLGIAKGELDPNKERIDPYGGRKKGELEKMLGFMLGDKNAGME